MRIFKILKLIKMYFHIKFYLTEYNAGICCSIHYMNQPTCLKNTNISELFKKFIDDQLNKNADIDGSYCAYLFERGKSNIPKRLKYTRKFIFTYLTYRI